MSKIQGSYCSCQDEEELASSSSRIWFNLIELIWLSFKNVKTTKISNEKLAKSYRDCKRNQRIFTHNRCLADFSKAKEAQEVKELSLKKDMKSGKRYRLHGWHSFCVWHMCQLFALAFIVFFLRKHRLKITSFKDVHINLKVGPF